MNNKKILIYLHFLKSGAGKSAVAYANTLSKNGFDVAVVSSTSSPKILGMLDRGVDVYLTDSRRAYHAIPSLCRKLKEYKPDVVLVVGGGNSYSYLFASLISGVENKLVIREAVSQKILIESENNYFICILKKLLLKKAYNKACNIIALTKDMRDEIINYWGVPEDRVVLIPNGVVVPPHSHGPKSNPDVPMILSVGRLQPQKDHETLLKAFTMIRAKRPCRLVLVGDGKVRQRLERIAGELGIEPDVQFLGHVDDVGPLYREARLTVLSSRYEGFPNVLIESLAHGCPVVATDCPTGPAEIINSNNVGLLAEVGNPNDIADKILLALDSEYDIDGLISRAGDFSIENASKKIVKLFSDV